MEKKVLEDLSGCPWDLIRILVLLSHAVQTFSLPLMNLNIRTTTVFLYFDAFNSQISAQFFQRIKKEKKYLCSPHSKWHLIFAKWRGRKSPQSTEWMLENRRYHETVRPRVTKLCAGAPWARPCGGHISIVPGPAPWPHQDRGTGQCSILKHRE